MKSKFALRSLNGLILAGLLATAGVGVMAQSAPATTTRAAASTAENPDGRQGGHAMMGRHDPAKMQAWMAKRQTELKTKLKIAPTQESAWTSFTAAMQPPAGMGQRPTAEQRADFDKLTTPQRIDKMREMRTQRMSARNAAMEKRGEATKAFYAALTPEQQKTFDSETLRMGRQGGRHHHEGGMQRRG